MFYVIRNFKQLRAELAKMSGIVCITGIKLPAWLKRCEIELSDNLTVDYLPEQRLGILEQTAYIDGMHNGRINKMDLVITQAPFIISDFPRSNVLVFEARGQVASPEFETFGASVNKITMCLLKRAITMGDYAKRNLDGLVKRLDTGDDPTKLISEVEHSMGDSVEKCIFINNCIHKEEDLAKHTGKPNGK
jgi:hypothetical protein